MFTYFIYNFILIGSTFNAYCYNKTRNKNLKIVFITFSFLIPFIFLALRYNIGQDYHNYIEIIHRIETNGWTNVEFGYYYLNYILIYLGMDSQWSFIIIGFVTFILIYKSAPKKDLPLFIFLVITIFYLYYGYSAIRQGLAVAIMTYATRYIIERKVTIYIFLSFFAMSFHLATGIILLVLYPFINISINKYFMLFFLLLLLIISQFIDVVSSSFFILKSFVPKYAYLYQASSSFAHVAISPYGLLGPLLKLLPVFIVILFKDKIEKLYKDARIIINYTFLYGIFIIFAMQIQIVNRIKDMFIIYFIISLVYFTRVFKNKSRLMVIAIIILMYWSWYMRYIIIAKPNIDNGQNVNPYQTILFGRE